MIKSYKDYLTEAEQSLGPQPGDYLHLITEDGVTSIQLDEAAPLAALGAVGSAAALARVLKIPLSAAKKLWKKHKGKLGFLGGALAFGGGSGASGDPFKAGYDLASKQFVGSDPLIETLNKQVHPEYLQNISHFVLDLR